MVWAYLTENADTKGMEAFRMALFKPPPGAASEAIRTLPEWSATAQGEMFMAAMAAKSRR